jgi:hypothetical protein
MPARTYSTSLFALVISILAFVGAIWLPSTMPTTGYIEEWELYATIDQGIPYYNINLFQTSPSRSVYWFIFAFGYWMTPDSAIGLHLITLLIFVAKPILFYGLVRNVFPQLPTLALMAGLLFTIYPADSAILNTRIPHEHASIIAYLAAVNLLFIYAKSPRLRYLLAIWVTQALSIFVIEITMPFMVLSPLLLWLSPSRPKISMKRLFVVWYLLPIIGTLVLLFTYTKGNSYQGSMFAADTELGIQRYLVSFVFVVIAEFRAYIHGWIEIVGLALKHLTLPRLLSALVATGVIIAGGLMQFRAMHWVPRRIDTRSYMRVAFLGTVIVAIGFAPFALIPHRSDFERTYLLSSMGATITVLFLLLIISRRFSYMNTIFTVLASVMLGIALLGTQGRYQQMVDFSVWEQRMLADFVQQMPDFDSQATIVLFDEPMILRKSHWRFAAPSGSATLEHALQYLYKKPGVNFWLCYPNPPEHIEIYEHCEIDQDGFRFADYYNKVEQYPINRVIAFAYDAQADRMVLLEKLPDTYFSAEAAKAYEPHRWIDTTAPVPERVKSLLANWLVLSNSKLGN